MAKHYTLFLQDQSQYKLDVHKKSMSPKGYRPSAHAVGPWTEAKPPRFDTPNRTTEHRPRSTIIHMTCHQIHTQRAEENLGIDNSKEYQTWSYAKDASSSSNAHRNTPGIRHSRAKVPPAWRHKTSTCAQRHALPNHESPNTALSSTLHTTRHSKQLCIWSQHNSSERLAPMPAESITRAAHNRQDRCAEIRFRPLQKRYRNEIAIIDGAQRSP